MTPHGIRPPDPDNPQETGQQEDRPFRPQVQCFCAKEDMEPNPDSSAGPDYVRPGHLWDPGAGCPPQIVLEA